MTLNTFHFAGRGEMNVTLGIPRMREILMVASANIATPTMDLHLLPRPDAEQCAEELRVRISSVSLSQVLERVTVKEMLHVRGKLERFRRYRVHFQFLPRRAYRKALHATPAHILHYMETKFLRRLIEAIKRRMEEISSERMTHVAKARERRGGGAPAVESGGGEPSPLPDDVGESSDEGEGDGDTVTRQAAVRHTQEREYEEAEEEERLAVAAQSDEELLYGDENPAGGEATQVGTADMTAEEILASVQEVVRSEEAEKRRQTRIFAVVKYNSWVLEYDYDDVKEEWCTFTFQVCVAPLGL
ncbi:hypothetical protein V5799_012526 [Amblyomma americanum]|uniref:DNA-directed RNA polymerase n=1 Tax=Amblyomma americanum TaxID=6943 RepID=A0AAQ4EE00_AMBAM